MAWYLAGENEAVIWGKVEIQERVNLRDTKSTLHNPLKKAGFFGIKGGQIIEY